MSPNLPMGTATLRVVDELSHVERLLHVIAESTEELARHPRQADRLTRLREHLAEAQARLEGVRVFVVECQKSVDRTTTAAEEEFDVWV